MTQAPTFVSLSTIPPRFDALGPTLRSILSQDLAVREIRLYIPEQYRRFPQWDGRLPEVPEGVTIHRAATDWGPATKILPAMRDLDGQDVDILFCDDDKIYDASWHTRFKQARADLPNACIVEVGENFPDISDSARPKDRLPRARRWPKDWRYRLTRIFSLGTIKPNVYRFGGYVDQLSGYGGVMVRPGWLDAAAYDIPEILWTVDDPWISGHLERAGIPIWLIGGPRRQTKGSAGGRRHALQDLTEQDHDRVRADLAAIGYFRETYGIWQPSGPVDQDYRLMTSSMRALARQTLNEPPAPFRGTETGKEKTA